MITYGEVRRGGGDGVNDLLPNSLSPYLPK